MKANTIHFDEKILGPEKAFEVINESYLSWKELKEVVKEDPKNLNEYKRRLYEKAKLYHM